MRSRANAIGGVATRFDWIDTYAEDEAFVAVDSMGMPAFTPGGGNAASRLTVPGSDPHHARVGTALRIYEGNLIT